MQPPVVQRSAPIAFGLALLTCAAALPAALQDAALAAPALRSAPQQLPLEAEWCLGTGSTSPGPCIALEVADEAHEQAMGLQLRAPLPPLHGMWFPYATPSLARYWMHRTPEPLDMLFVRQGRVIAIEAHVRPCLHLPCPSYGPDESVDGVVELAAGQAEHLGISVGSPVRIKPLPARPAAGASVR
ncbi:MAG: DUF192 domain-containing protein [Synechococcaceae cyanobacterium]|nr:DUF192 domain-containing protein [Synechococcaceae cyanobacterium]